jgi:hypothetical protein
MSGYGGLVPRDFQVSNLGVDRVVVVQREIATPLVITQRVEPPDFRDSDDSDDDDDPRRQINITADIVTANTVAANTVNARTVNTRTLSATTSIDTPSLSTSTLFTNTLTATNATITGTLTTSGSLGFDSLTLTAPTNQLTLSTTTINCPTPASARLYQIPDAGVNTFFLMGAGSQIIAGSKTFQVTLNLNPSTNQLRLGSFVGNTTTINSPAPAASRIYTIPDAGTDSSFVMADGAQTINGVKTFTSEPVFPSLSLASLTLSATTNQLVLGTTNTTTLTSPAPSASRTYTIPDSGGNTSFVMGAGNQTIAGTKTFSSSITLGTGFTLGISISLTSSGLSFDGGISRLGAYSTETFTLTYTSTAFSGSVPVVLNRATRIGNVVTLFLDTFSTSGTGTAGTIGSTAIPAFYRPSTTQLAPVRVENANNDTGGTVRVGTDGILTFYRADYTTNNMLANFTNSSTLGIFAQSVTFSLGA